MAESRLSALSRNPSSSQGAEKWLTPGVARCVPLSLIDRYREVKIHFLSLTKDTDPVPPFPMCEELGDCKEKLGEHRRERKMKLRRLEVEQEKDPGSEERQVRRELEIISLQIDLAVILAKLKGKRAIS
jgi:hypothetical protein